VLTTCSDHGINVVCVAVCHEGDDMRLFLFSCIPLHTSYSGEIIEEMFQRAWEDHMVGLYFSVDDDLFIVDERGFRFFDDIIVKETGQPLNTAVYKEIESPWADPDEV
jgi:hypothetical protein